MRLLIADKLHPRAIEELRTLPLEVVYEPELTKESLEKRLQGVGVLIVRSTEVTAAAIESTKQLNLIVRAGASYDTIDVRAASRRGIYVANCPGKNASAVAELVVGLMVALDRRIPDAVASLQGGKWERKEYGKAEGLTGARWASPAWEASVARWRRRRVASGSTCWPGAGLSRPRAPTSSGSPTPPRSTSSRRRATRSACTWPWSIAPGRSSTGASSG